MSLDDLLLPEPEDYGSTAFDAALTDKRAWQHGAIAGLGGRPVLFPDDAAANAAGSRAAVAGEHNWVPVGPRSVGGRVRALAIHPTNPRIIYAGAASGGVHRTRDGGETWTALFHEQASLGIGAIGISRSDPDRVWVATGEILTGGSEVIRGDGIWLSDDGGDTWTNPATPHVPGTGDHRGFAFDAIAPDPTDSDRCWAVGPAGVFRTIDAGVHWTHFANTHGDYFSDAAFTEAPDGSSRLLLVKIDTDQFDGAVVVRVADPSLADAAIDAVLEETTPLPAHMTHVAVGAPSGRGKLTVGVVDGAAYAGDIGYLRLVSQTDPFSLFGPDRISSHQGVFHCLDLMADPQPWTRLPNDHPDWVAVGPNGLPIVQQGTYNLSIAVNPKNPDQVVTGMIDVHLTSNGRALVGGAPAATWIRAMAFDLYTIDRAHHEDHHAAVFDPVADPPPLWVANDGGVSVSIDWHKAPVDPYPVRSAAGTTLPMPPNVITWRKRSHGIAAAQMYSVDQSALVPSMYACGFQDNGVHLTAGGNTWRLVIPADGGATAFDPDDPYRCFVTWQDGIADVRFPGRLAGTLPIPGDAVRQSLWPRELRRGFSPLDTGTFRGVNVPHPRKGGRLLHSRLNRLYGMRPDTVGTDFEVEPVGRSFELITSAAPGGDSRLAVLPCTAGMAFGLEPQTDARFGAAFRCQVRSLRPGPYRLAAGSELRLEINGTARTIRFGAAGSVIHDLAAATVAEVCAEINRQLAVAPAVTTTTCRPVFWSRPQEVELLTDAVSTAAAPVSITLGGSVLPMFNIAPGRYEGAVDHPALVSFPIYDPRAGSFTSLDNGAGPPLDITVQIGTGPVHRLALTAPPFSVLGSIRCGELEQTLRGLLAGEAVTVRSVGVVRRIRIAPLPGANLILGNTAEPVLNFTRPSTGEALLQEDSASSSLSPLNPGGPPLRLRLEDGAHQRTIVFDATTGINDLDNVKHDELLRVVKAAIADGGLNLRADTVQFARNGTPTVAAFSPSDPDRVWVGGTDGHVFASDDDGRHWTEHGQVEMWEQDRRVSAIAFHPTDRDTVYVGFFGERRDLSSLTGSDDSLGTSLHDSGFLFRTSDGGAHFDHIGADVKDANDHLVSINALVTDREEPDALYAATNIGVFRSPDRGTTWEEFNAGLPNVNITDLVLEPATRMLRAGAWGRSVHERHVGDRPSRDVSIYVRANVLDEGRDRPPPRGPDPFAPFPAAAASTASPDIKLRRTRPPLIGPDELVDGAEFDDEIEHEDPLPGPTNLFVQVHNRGSFAATGVRVVRLWCDATHGPPPLPDDFWASLESGPLTGSIGGWTVIADAVVPGAAGNGHDRVSASDPRVTSHPVEFPGEIEAMARVGLLVLVTCPDDAITTRELTVARLLDSDRRVSYRECATVRAADDARLHLIGRNGVSAARFHITDPAAGDSAMGPLGLAPMPMPAPPAPLPLVDRITGGTEPFNLATASPPAAVQVSLQPDTLTVTFTAGDIMPASLAVVAAQHVRLVLERELFRHGLMVDATITGPLLAPATALRLSGRNGAVVQITGGSVAPIMGLPVGGAPLAAITSAPQTAAGYNLTGPAVADLTLSITRRRVVPFALAQFADPAAATAAEVRAVINRELGVLSLPVSAVRPTVRLGIRASATDAPSDSSTLGGAHLADVVVSTADVAEPDRADLFRLVSTHDRDRAGAGTNFVYLRTFNTGNADQPGARHRLFEIDPAAFPAPATPFGGEQLADLVTDGRAITRFEWELPDAATGDRRLVLAVVDVEADDPVDLPAAFETHEHLDEFCGTRAGVAYRVVEVG